MTDDTSIVDEGLYMTEEQYLALDEATDGKYEFYNGYAVMLRPPSSLYDERAMVDEVEENLAHAALCVRLGSLIDQTLMEGPCIVYSSDARLNMGTGRQYFYPDLRVVCDDPDKLPKKMLTQPIVLIEVLSPGTEKRDRGAKLASYKALPSLMEYMLVGSQVKEIVVYRRESDWHPYHYQSGDTVELKSIGVSFSFDAVYRRIIPG